MRLLARLALPAAASALLLLGAFDARADMCAGGGTRVFPDTGVAPAPDAGQSAADGGLSWHTPFTRQLGTGLLAAAALSTGWVCFRRKGDGQE